jgi:NitT/TauT family transport system permease protein
MSATRRAFDTMIIVIAIVLLWQGLAQWVGDTALPGPAPTFVYLAHFVPTARFAENAAATAIAFALALLLAYGLGLAIGVWMGAQRLSGEVGESILITLYSLPKITLYPVILLIFGLTLSGKVVFGAIHGVLPVALLTMAAIRNIPMVYLKAARTLRLSSWQTIWNVLLPATIPEVLAGLRIGFTVTLLGVLLAEMFASKDGLGFLIINAMTLLQTKEMISIAVVLFAFAAVANAILLWIEHRLHQRA